MFSIKDEILTKVFLVLLGHEKRLYCNCNPVQILMKCWYVAFLCFSFMHGSSNACEDFILLYLMFEMLLKISWQVAWGLYSWTRVKAGVDKPF